MCGQLGQKLYLGSLKQGQEPCVCAAVLDGPPDPVGPTRPLHHARPVHGAGGLCHIASFGDVPGNSCGVLWAGNVSI